ncbi:MAG: hypothetical protein KC636_18365 [Myxococcales bacterium]|nr:hypothetical protein [Myxococcales bacterium]
MSAARWRLWAALCGALVAIALIAIGPPPSLHEDTLRDLLLARDCLAGRGCLGASTSFPGLRQHGLWVRFLAALTGGGLDVAAIHLVISIANGLAAAVVLRLAAPLVAASTAFAAALASAALFALACDAPVLWNPSLAPLSQAVLYAGLLGLARAGGWPHAALAGLGVALVTEVHVAGALTLALLVIVVVAYARRPALALAVGLAVFFAVEALASREPIAQNLGAPVIVRVLLPLWAAGLTWCGLWAGWLRRFGDEPRARAIVVLVVSLGVATAAPLAGAVATGHFLDARYFLAGVIPAALLGAVALERWRRPSADQQP